MASVPLLARVQEPATPSLALFRSSRTTFLYTHARRDHTP